MGKVCVKQKMLHVKAKPVLALFPAGSLKVVRRKQLVSNDYVEMNISCFYTKVQKQHTCISEHDCCQAEFATNNQ